MTAPENLYIKNETPASKYLVFTSAGDNTNLHLWLEGEKNFDLWITYYGKGDDHLKGSADYYNARKGGKYPNFYYAYQNWENLLERYEAILVMDDDIVISATDISRLFEIRNKYDLWVLQPAFSPVGKWSHPITIVRPFSLLRFTDFVENGCPLFKWEKLAEFMKVYDPNAASTGYGIDWWYLHVLGTEIAGKIAIVDAVCCINPLDQAKSGQREVDNLQTLGDSVSEWKRIKQKYGISRDEHGYRSFGSIKEGVQSQDLRRCLLFALNICQRGVMKIKFHLKID